MRIAAALRPIPEARAMTGGWTPTLPELRSEGQVREAMGSRLRAYERAPERPRTVAPSPVDAPPDETDSDELTICTVT